MPVLPEGPESPVETAQEALPPEEAPTEEPETDILVVYFSRTGNTKALAEYAIDFLKADSFEIEAAVPYSDEDIAYYTNCRADQEQADLTARPEIANRVPNLRQYHMILLGYPIWHGQAPRIISTFLESYDFSEVTILPFCTSHSSPIGNSDKNLHGLCNARWMEGKRFSADGDEQAFAEWLSVNIPAAAIQNEENPMPKELTLMVNDTVIPVSWEDNPSVTELFQYVSGEPVHIVMKQYGGWEQVGPLGRSIPGNDIHLTADIGDIMLYSGNQIVLFYGENSWAYTKLGHIDLTEEEITNLLSHGAVQITLAVQ